MSGGSRSLQISQRKAHETYLTRVRAQTPFVKHACFANKDKCLEQRRTHRSELCSRVLCCKSATLKLLRGKIPRRCTLDLVAESVFYPLLTDFIAFPSPLLPANRLMYSQFPFFKTVLSFTQLNLEKSDTPANQKKKKKRKGGTRVCV